jgi:hypothetical protein
MRKLIFEMPLSTYVILNIFKAPLEMYFNWKKWAKDVKKIKFKGNISPRYILKLRLLLRYLKEYANYLRKQGLLTVPYFDDLFKFEETIFFMKDENIDVDRKNMRLQKKIIKKFNYDVISIRDFFAVNKKIPMSLKPEKIKVLFHGSGTDVHRIN